MRDIRQKTNVGNKILIIGCAGSGKTTLAKHLTKLIGLPIIHLDNYYWTENWGRKSDEEWSDIIKDLCKQPKWIMDGNYTKTMATRFKPATTIIYLDIPRWQCLLRVLIRRFRFIHNKERDDIPYDCKERINFDFYRWIWNYPKRSRHVTLKLLQMYKGPVYRLKSNRDIRGFLKNINLTITHENTRN